MDDIPSENFATLDLHHGFSRLWARGIRGDGVTVAVIDTGIDPIAILGDSVVLSRDFTREREPSRGRPLLHGTQMAMAIRLAAPGVKIADLKVLPVKSVARRKDVIEAIHFCVEEWPRYPIINLSLSFPRGWWRHNVPGRCSLCTAVEKAVEAGILVITAAGNTGGAIQCPGVTEGAFNVGASSNSADEKWWAAQGRFRIWWLKQTGRLAKHFGTSFSAAYTTGGVALILSAFPNLSLPELRRCVKQVGRRLSDLQPWEDYREVNLEDHLACLIGKETMDREFPWPYASPLTYRDAVSRLQVVAYATAAQRADNAFVTDALDVIVGVYSELVNTHPRAVEGLNQILGLLVPGCFPEYENRLRELAWPVIEAPLERVTDADRVVIAALRLMRYYPTTATAAKVIEELLPVDAAAVSKWYQDRVREFISHLLQDDDREGHQLLIDVGLPELQRRWLSNTKQTGSPAADT